MSDPKTTAETLGRVVGDFLKWEATPLTRAKVAAAKGTKAGTFVDYAPRAGKKLLALTDEQDGIVIVQPHNCIIDLTLVADAAVKAAASAGGNLDGLKDDRTAVLYLRVGQKLRRRAGRPVRSRRGTGRHPAQLRRLGCGRGIHHKPVRPHRRPRHRIQRRLRLLP